MTNDLKYRAVRIDETEYFTVDNAEYVEHIYTYYIYNPGVHTYLCCMYPSYWMNAVRREVVYHDGTPDSIIDQIYGLSTILPDEDKYMDCRTVDKMDTYEVEMTGDETDITDIELDEFYNMEAWFYQRDQERSEQMIAQWNELWEGVSE